MNMVVFRMHVNSLYLLVTCLVIVSSYRTKHRHQHGAENDDHTQSINDIQTIFFKNQNDVYLEQDDAIKQFWTNRYKSKSKPDETKNRRHVDNDMSHNEEIFYDHLKYTEQNLGT